MHDMEWCRDRLNWLGTRIDERRDRDRSFTETAGTLRDAWSDRAGRSFDDRILRPAAESARELDSGLNGLAAGLTAAVATLAEAVPLLERHDTLSQTQREARTEAEAALECWSAGRRRLKAEGDALARQCDAIAARQASLEF